MGGDGTPHQDEDYSPVDQDVVQPSSSSSLNKTVTGEYGLKFGGFEDLGCGISISSLEFEADQRKRCKAFDQVLQSYDELRSRAHNLNEAKSKILSYTPGGWMEEVGGMKLSDFNVPKTTTLLLVGPRGSGKSSLVNRISKVFEDGKFTPERAQVSYNSSAVEGTYFLQEYMIPRGSTSFCLYDTRSLSDDYYDNIKILKDWMTKGVRHGELIVRPCDSSSLKKRMKCKSRENDGQSKETRMVNFVIFVVSGLAVLKSLDSEVEGENEYTQIIAKTFNCPYLSFKDYKPAVVVTHGDLLSLTDRARIRVQLGVLLGIPPAKQIFDIPESCDPVTELTIIDMLHYSLEHADRNFPHKDWIAEKFHTVRGSLSACVHLFIILGISLILINIRKMHMHHAPEPEDHIHWHTIRHLWLG